MRLLFPLRCNITTTYAKRGSAARTGPSKSGDPDFNAPPEIASVPSFVNYIASRGYCDGAMGPTPSSAPSSSAPKCNMSVGAGLDAIVDAEDEGGDEGGGPSGSKGAASHGPAWWMALQSEASSSRGEASGIKSEGAKEPPSHYLCIAVREARNLAAVDFDTKSTTS